jgi:GDP-4-dehydro-6-deoxy-D-mannose reductase
MRAVRYLITGCFGFVGAHLVRHLRLVDPAAEIIALDRHAAPPGFPEVTRSYELDLLEEAALSDVFAREQPERLVHLASFSSVGFSWENPVESFKNNTNIFLAVLEQVRRCSRHTRVLSVGSSDEYGLVRSDELPLRETSPLRPLSPYAVARVAQEHLGEVYVRGFGLDIVSTRSFNHIGPGQSPTFVVSALAKQFAELARGKRASIAVGTTSVVRDFLDVRDVVGAYTALLERGTRGEVYNICSGRGASIANVIDMLATIAEVKPAITVDPALLRPVENELVVGAHDKITQAIGWRPTHTLEESLRAVYADWLARV